MNDTRGGTTFFQNWVTGLLLILFPPLLLQGSEIRVLPQAQNVAFPDGYDVIDGSDFSVVKRVGGPAQANVKAYVDGQDGRRYFMSDWSWEQRQAGKKFNWMRANAPAAPAPRNPAAADPVAVLERPVEMLFENGYQVFDSDGRLLKNVTGRQTATIQAHWREPDAQGRRRFITDWSWTRYVNEGVRPNWIVPLAAPRQPVATLPQPSTPRIGPELQRIYDIDDQVRRLLMRGRFREALVKSKEAEAAYRAGGFDREMDELFWSRRTTLNTSLALWEDAEASVLEALKRSTSEGDRISNLADYARILERLGKANAAKEKWDLVARDLDEAYYHEEEEIRKALIAFYLRRGDFVALEKIPDAPEMDPGNPEEELEKLSRRMTAFYAKLDRVEHVQVEELIDAAHYFHSLGDGVRTAKLLDLIFPAILEDPWDAYPFLPQWTRVMIDSGRAKEARGRLRGTGISHKSGTVAIALSWKALGEPDHARDLFRRAVKELEPFEVDEEGEFEFQHEIDQYHQLMAEAYIGAGQPQELLAFLNRKFGNLETLGFGTPQFIEDAVLAGALFSGDRKLASQFASRRVAEQRDQMQRAITVFPENKREAFVNQIRPLDLPFSLDDPALAANAVLQFKGIVLDSLARERRRLGRFSGEVDEGKMEQLRKLKQALLHQSLSGAPGELLRPLESRIEALERDIFGLSAASRSSIDLSTIDYRNVQRGLAKGDTLVEFAVYGHLTGYREKERRMAAVVIPSGGAPRILPLGSAKSVEDAVGEVRRWFTDEFHRLGSGAIGLEAFDRGAHAALRGLYDRVWLPLEPALAGTKRLFVSPAGAMNFAPLAAAPDSSGAFATEKWSIRQLGSGRDLVSGQAPSSIRPGRATAWLLGNPDYEAKTSPPAGATSGFGRRTLMRSLETSLGIDGLRAGRGFLPFDPELTKLPGTEEEIRVLQGLFSPAGIETRTLRGDGATETAFRWEESPRILHLATHGFFMPVVRLSGSTIDSEAVQDPMARSFIALSGATRTLRSWDQGKVPAPENDGLLMAAEVATMDLNNTELVVLSACQSGLGENVAGEGVFGLKRALRQAGARNVVSTLWDIADKETVELIADFYRRILDGDSPGDAMAAAQTAMLRRYTKELGPGIAAYFSGAFVADVSAP